MRRSRNTLRECVASMLLASRHHPAWRCIVNADSRSRTSNSSASLHASCTLIGAMFGVYVTTPHRRYHPVNVARWRALHPHLLPTWGELMGVISVCRDVCSIYDDAHIITDNRVGDASRLRTYGRIRTAEAQGYAYCVFIRHRSQFSM